MMRAVVTAMAAALFAGSANAQIGGATGPGTVSGATVSAPQQLLRYVATTSSTNDQNLYIGAGRLLTSQGCVSGGSARYIRIYDSAAAPARNSDGTTSAIPVWSFIVPSGPCTSNPPGLDIVFQNGISIDVTGGPADNDGTPLDAGDTTLNLTIVPGN